MPTQTAEVQQVAFERITKNLPAIYVVIALLVSLPLCLLTPPFFVPDEANHSARAIEIGHGEWMSHRTPEGVGAAIDANAAAVMLRMRSIEKRVEDQYPIAHQRPDGRVSEAELAPLRGLRWSGQSAFRDFTNTAVYPPVLYLPQAIGWRLGEAFDLTILHSLLLARLLAALSAIGIGWLAMRLCVSGQWLLFAYLLLPTELSLNASCSQDALLFAVAGLLMAILTRPIHAGRLFKASELVAFTALLMICIAARPPYLPLVFLLLLPALDLRGIEWRQILPSVFAIVIVLAVLGGWEAAVHSLGNAIGPDANPAHQIKFLEGHPLAGAKDIVFGTLREVPALGGKGLEVLGANDVFPPAAIYGLLLMGLAGIALLGPMDGLRSMRSRAVLLFALTSTVAGISFAEYVIWTSPGSNRVGGLQSRYYLTLIPLAFFLISRRWNESDQVDPKAIAKRQYKPLLLIAGAVFVVAVLYTPWVAAHHFYKLGLNDAAHLALRK